MIPLGKKGEIYARVIGKIGQKRDLMYKALILSINNTRSRERRLFVRDIHNQKSKHSDKGK
jgi:hypothetical protein